MSERVFKGRIPTVAAMVDRLHWLDKVGDPAAVARSARKIMESERNQATAMRKLDRIFQTHGVEYIKGIGEYLNTGDSYTATIIARDGHYIVSSWGDLVEHSKAFRRDGYAGGVSASSKLAEARAFAATVVRAFRAMPPGKDRDYFIGGVYDDLDAGFRGDLSERPHVRERFAGWKRSDFKAASYLIDEALSR